MKYSYFLAVILFTAGCQTDVSAPSSGGEKTFWYDTGYQDAASGMVVKDNSALEEWFGNPQVDRDAYLRGYNAGQADFCHAANMREWGKSGKSFPASCDGTANAEQLRTEWQQHIE
ncbi:MULTISPECIES: DUF2799 domain-containing protein [unclassified Brenneria]|uniref:DUF2799 domain-containing protein n=1 Tax=unclassified Brenneria TaxID=2634434 RepID=UPI001551D43E|nr:MULTISPECIES: DUF2799 domain-containing protein [unclassified Brenneria]MBJ7224013.1 DUF2799 domain-containing protein [Brenneria sp. L3-3C-1]MEE3645258.1 DUF2799 domain-containing protein [Brenneria sp. L3_3C_1]MEE3653036.1 DUF2799 domain-containing protein [Brenneria sp. HEZEL_4_2_4]NPD02989.1 DUF2799 domain-containing protein [Brenneria sp. hezel4-2-4]